MKSVKCIVLFTLFSNINKEKNLLAGGDKVYTTSHYFFGFSSFNQDDCYRRYLEYSTSEYPFVGSQC